MGDETGIEWADKTWSPWGGCQAVSAGCDHCYAEQMDKRFGKAWRWGANGLRDPRSHTYMRQPDRWNRQAAATGVRLRVFPSMCDPFDNHRTIRHEWRSAMWATIRHTPHLDWLLLTKRPQNIAGMLPLGWGDGWPNVWLGTTCENQEEADRRIPHLLRVPARVRFLSCEPLLGPINLTWLGQPVNCNGVLDALRGESWIEEWWDSKGNDRRRKVVRAWPGKIHWVIAGGESCPGARPSHPDWFCGLRDQCHAAGVPFFFKQWGEWLPCVTESDGQRLACWSDDGSTDNRLEGLTPRPVRNLAGQEMWRVGKRLAGATLDGRTHKAFPSTHQAAEVAP